MLIKYKKIKDFREDHDYTQEFVSQLLGTSRSNYANWENGDVLIPLDKIDLLSTHYNVSISYLLGIKSNYKNSLKIKPINYQKLLSNLKEYKSILKLSYTNISDYLGVSRSTAYKYFVGKLKMPVDKLILLSELFNVDLDKLCGKI